ncbi:hypothetical protein IAQ61_000765 [Plenodomus lingam]|uniref:Uncharacterized protein n=1 Tax=Leptosphaeria maculans (strain JN3 / isolate v23.1.3 / race Av1-4-5-6-7-8) TaxID=985895 RepID=E5A664_LEPMJ|nr:hypothetical protein LEMA_P083480.1 [Plenodomus lingam JN3]KAH9880474.1 hypothetical protein IAQ61_000765 [Plenodomus lingam]CBX99109.1 hypothetical protein LEMA_P083480.1 [Plenodomus lingam JN3]
MASLARNNAFGCHSPSWNLAFPDGQLTAIEILAYLPHWLKSVDVIDRFVANGGKSRVIAAIINEFRDQPTGAIFQANSAQIMMSFAMRRAGYVDWTVGTSHEWARAVNKEEGDLSVTDFRTPRITHPKHISKTKKPLHEAAQNEAAGPVAFKDLALHVKKHPSGEDALDLSRCVRYALEHADEDWLFPDHFAILTHRLGGPARVTHSHLDRQAFARREILFASPCRTSTLTDAPRPKAMPTPRIARAIEEAVVGFQPGNSANSNRKRKLGADSSKMATSNKRRSSRLVGKNINFREESDVEDVDESYLQSPYSKRYATSAKTRRLGRSPSNDSDFVGGASEPDEDIPESEVASGDDETSLTPKLRRMAAQKARKGMQSAFVGESSHTSTMSKGKANVLLPAAQPAYMSTVVRPEVLNVAKKFAFRRPVWLAPPILSANRLKVDSSSLRLYAAEDCTTESEMWFSALSCYRFYGPRRHPPFRELHRLTDPNESDSSDWAENIRWAKEQCRAFGSDTWTEYDHHLETITEHRRESMWVSEETIKAGM